MKALALTLAAAVLTVVVTLTAYTVRHACNPSTDTPCYVVQPTSY